MSAAGFVHLDVLLVKKSTGRAMLLVIDGVDGEHWIPLSQMADPDDYEEGDENVTIIVTEWIARLKGLDARDRA